MIRYIFLQGHQKYLMSTDEFASHAIHFLQYAWWDTYGHVCAIFAIWDYYQLESIHESTIYHLKKGQHLRT